MATGDIARTQPVTGKAAPFERVRFTVGDYYRMVEAGILHEDSRVELIEGELIVMSPIGSRHAACVLGLGTLFHARVGRDALVSAQNPLRLDDRSEPEPDIMLLRPRPDRYAGSHPGPADVLLLIEVMDSSAGYDRGVKLPLYARSAVAEVWLVDLNHDLIEIHRRPVAGLYTEYRIVSRGQTLAPGALPDVVLAADDILG